MRASDLLTAHSVDMKFLPVERICLEEKDHFLPIREIRLIDETLLIIGMVDAGGMTTKDILLALMLHK